MAEKVNIFWFRRDLRLEDNVGFSKALQGQYPVLPIFIFDSNILSELPKDDARVTFIFESIQGMRKVLQKHRSSLGIFYGEPQNVFKNILKEFNVQNVIANHDYEPYARMRDGSIKNFLSENRIGYYTYKDQVIFEKDEVVKADGDPYIVYTPYMKRWKQKFISDHTIKEHKTSDYYNNLFRITELPNQSLEEIGFQKSKIKIPEYQLSSFLVQEYSRKRDFPAEDATTHLGPHLRFGTVSIRKIMKMAQSAREETFWQELIWREFFMQIIWHYPETVNRPFKEKYDRIEWRNNETEFQKWKEGKTGYPLVDAGMRQLNTMGFMHNRVRMVTASFLCKHLLIDWRWGEAYFAQKLLDYELASNIGNWQWAAGTGVDAAPYFRIFNPTTQIEKFDKNHQYIKKYVPEFDTKRYPEKMVDHKEARERCLRVFKKALQ